MASWISGRSLIGCGPGGVVEWLMAPVLKTGVPKGTVGSNPTSSVFRQCRTAITLSGEANFNCLRCCLAAITSVHD